MSHANATNQNPAAAAIVEAEGQAEVKNAVINDREEFSAQSMKLLTDDSRDMKIPTGWKRNARTNCTATPIDMNVLTDMTVCIVYIPKKDTHPVSRRRIQWEVACYTNDCIQHIVWNALAEGVGREKRVAKQVSFKKC